MNGGAENEFFDILKRNISEFAPETVERNFITTLATGVLEKRDALDAVIAKAARDWPLEQTPLVDRNVLRIGLYELLFAKKDEVPERVAINEAIELGKSFGGERSGKFVNGVLGTIYKEMGEPGKDDEPKKKRKFKRKEDLTPEEKEQLPLKRLVGAVVYHVDGKGNTQLAFVHDVFGYWTLAKGSPKEDESLEDAVLRKVKEEEGLSSTKVVEKLGENEYVAHDPDKGNVRRGVVYFLVKASDAELRLGSTGGLDDVRWFSEQELGELKMYDDVKGFMKKAIKIIK